MSERDDLENLLKSPGWLRVTSEALTTWNGQMGRYVTQAANDVDDQMALNKIRQVVAAKTAVEKLIAWPTERLRALADVTEREHAGPSMSRGGR